MSQLFNAASQGFSHASPGQVRAAGATRTVRKRHHAMSGRRPPGFTHQALRVQGNGLMVRWAAGDTWHELALGHSAHGLQVRRTRWPLDGPTTVLTFLLRSRAEFRDWHAGLMTRFEFPAGHDALLRFGHECLGE